MGTTRVISKTRLIYSFLFMIMPSIAVAGIAGSAHDFSATGWSGGQICIACHTPHNSDSSIIDAPLWNHQLSSATYTVYTSQTMDVMQEQPHGPSKLCLSCHDGTIALDQFGGLPGSTYIGGAANLKTDLSDDHPVSVEWIHQTLETSNTFCFNCHFGAPSQLVFYRPNPNGPIWVECSTCHDVHNSTNLPNLLRRTMADSELCLTCHEK